MISVRMEIKSSGNILTVNSLKKMQRKAFLGLHADGEFENEVKSEW